MLVVHVSSTCDVCYDALSSSAGTAKAPYSIPCGHVFCRSCLLNIPPDRHSQQRRCPMCRGSYTNNDIHKLQLEYSLNSNSAKRAEVDEEMELVRAYIDHFAPEKGQPRGNEKRWTSLMETFHERKAVGKCCSYFDRLLELCSGSTKVNMEVAPRSINGSTKAPSNAGSKHSNGNELQSYNAAPHSINGSNKAPSDAGSNQSHSNGNYLFSHNDSLVGNRERLAKNARQDYLDNDGARGADIYNDDYHRSGPPEQYWGTSHTDSIPRISRTRFERTTRPREVMQSIRSWGVVHVSNRSRTAYYSSEAHLRIA